MEMPGFRVRGFWVEDEREEREYEGGGGLEKLSHVRRAWEGSENQAEPVWTGLVRFLDRFGPVL